MASVSVDAIVAALLDDPKRFLANLKKAVQKLDAAYTKEIDHADDEQVNEWLKKEWAKWNRQHPEPRDDESPEWAKWDNAQGAFDRYLNDHQPDFAEEVDKKWEKLREVMSELPGS